jgi:ABC-type phosphate transport system auxiliary subunit
MIIFREMHAASDQKQNLRQQLRICQRDLSAANLEKEKLNGEVNLKSKLNKQLKDDLQHLKHKKRSLQKKVYELEKAISSPSGRNHRDSVLQRPEAVRRPKLTDPAEDDSVTSKTVRDWDINLVQFYFKVSVFFFPSLCKLRRTERFSSRAVHT